MSEDELQEIVMCREFLKMLGAINNPERAAYVHHKLVAKHYLEQGKYPVPKTYEILRPEKEEEIDDFDFGDLPGKFVVKSPRSDMGRAVKIVKGRDGDDFVLENGDKMTQVDMVKFMKDIYRGEFTTHGKVRNPDTGELTLMDTAKDVIYFEERLETCKQMEPYLKCGVADVRIAYYKLAPYHTRLRLATLSGAGRSNVSVGNAGPIVTIDGVTTGKGLLEGHGDLVSDTGRNLLGIEVPMWEECLKLGATVEHFFMLNTMNIDIALTNRGPVILELHGGSTVQGTDLDMRYFMRRIKAIEENITEVGRSPEPIDAAMKLGRRIFHEHDDEDLNFDDFCQFMNEKTGMEIRIIPTDPVIMKQGFEEKR